jgi:inner membrane protein
MPASGSDLDTPAAACGRAPRFPLLQLAPSALGLGSLLRFAVLAGVMVATRRVDWYTRFESLRRAAPQPAARPAQ